MTEISFSPQIFSLVAADFTIFDTYGKNGGIMSEALSLGKWAEKKQVKPASLKKAVQELAIEADFIKGACAYYSEERLKEAFTKAKSL